MLCRREKVRRKRAKAASDTVPKVQVATEHKNQQKPDIVELSKGLPSNWQVCFLGPFVLLYLNWKISCILLNCEVLQLLLSLFSKLFESENMISGGCVKVFLNTQLIYFLF